MRKKMNTVKISLIICLTITFNGLIERTHSFFYDMDGFSLFGTDVMDSDEDNIPLVGSLILGSPKYKMDKMIDHLSRLSNQLERMNVVINAKLDNIMKALMSVMPVRDDMKAGMKEFHTYIVRIDGLWAYYEKYVKNSDNFNQYTIENFIDATTSLEEGNLPNVLNRMHRLFVPGRSGVAKKSLFDLVLEFRKVSDPRTICDQSLASYQYRIFQLYKLIVLSEIRGFLMTVFSYGVLSVYKDAIFANELRTAEALFVLRSRDYLEKARDVMAQASNEILLCGTEAHERGYYFFNLPSDGKTFVEFEQFAQYFVSNEYELGDSQTCYYTCPEMTSGRVHRCPKDEYYNVERCVNSRPCKGVISKCGWCGPGKICHSPSDSIRRYQWLDVENTFYGQRRNCEGHEEYVETYNYRLYSCDVCLCVCFQDADDSPAIRTWSLRPQMADIKNNKVIIGAKFALKDDIVHIQVAQGVLGKYGIIEQAGVGILPLEDFHYNTSNNQWTATTSQINSEAQILEDGVDYMAMKFNDKRWVNIDDISLEKDYVITGVRLNKADISGDTHIGLELYATKFNFADGKLSTDDNDSYWVTPSSMKIKSEHYNSDERKGFRKNEDQGGDPEEITDNFVDSHPNQWIAIQTTSGWKDAGQHTIPYIDIRSVVPKPRFGLGGMGIYHKGDRSTAGYLALKVMHLDLSLYINPALSEEDMARYKQQSINKEIPKNDDQDLIDKGNKEIDDF